MLPSEYDGGSLESVASVGAVVFLDPVPMSKMSWRPPNSFWRKEGDILSSVDL